MFFLSYTLLSLADFGRVFVLCHFPDMWSTSATKEYCKGGWSAGAVNIGDGSRLWV
jgi:hypothetical protein